jgi:hypothetical protein
MFLFVRLVCRGPLFRYIAAAAGMAAINFMWVLVALIVDLSRVLPLVAGILFIAMLAIRSWQLCNFIRRNPLPRRRTKVRSFYSPGAVFSESPCRCLLRSGHCLTICQCWREAD